MSTFADLFANLTKNDVSSNENGALQPTVHGLVSKTDVLTTDQVGYLTEIFVKGIRGAPESLISNAVNAILGSASINNIVILVDALLRQMCMTRHIRDAGGKGERDQTYIFIRALWEVLPDVMSHVLPKFIPLTGYYKDYVVLIDQCHGQPKYDQLVKVLVTAHCQAIKSQDFLAGKWAPSEGTHYDKVAKLYAKHLGLNMRAYRKLLVTIRAGKLVETQMSAKDWYSVGEMLPTLPAGSQQKYTKAFTKHIPDEYSQFLTDVATGKAKINVTGLQIHTIIKKMLGGGYGYHPCRFNTALTEAELLLLNLTWKKFEDEVVKKMLEDEEFFNCFRKLCVIDQSGSMSGGPDVVAVTLGLFVSKALGRAEREHFGDGHVGLGDCVLRFAEKPNAIKLKPTEYISDYLQNFIKQVNAFSCGYSTDMVAVHKLVIKLTKLANNETAPGLLILTDMQYNRPDFHVGKIPHDDMIDGLYKATGLIRGEVFCWNLRGDTKTYHAEADKSGVQMIGGFNQTMLSLFFEGKKIAQETSEETKTSEVKATTWDTFVASQAHFDCVSEWLQNLYGKIEVTATMQVKNPAQAMFLRNLPADYISGWTLAFKDE